MRGRSVPLFVVATAVMLFPTTRIAVAATPGATKLLPVRPTTVISNGPDGLAIDTRTHTLYTADEAGSISVVDTRLCNARAVNGCGSERVGTVSLPPGSSPRGIAIDVATDTVYVADTGIDAVSVINGATCDAANRTGCTQTTPLLGHPSEPSVKTVHVGIFPEGIAVDPITDTVYVTNQGSDVTGHPGHTVSVINGATCNGRRSSGCGHVATVDVDREPERTGASPYVRTIGLDLHSGAVPSGVALDSANHSVYVVGQDSGTVSVLDTATCNARDRTGCRRPSATVRVDADPIGVAIDHGTNTVFVGTNGGATLSVIDAARCNATDHAGCRRTPTTITIGRSPFGPGVTRAWVGSGRVLSNEGTAHVV
jgi:DNA-binding beta-propeller fold protein YncE